MKANEAPKKHSTPFGVNGPREDILADTPSGSNQASYDDGFPAITMTLKSAGGLPPKGQDMNQILFELSSQGRYLSAGGGYTFDAAFATSLSGYPKGALIPNSTASGYWLNTVDDNSTNPENATGALTGWVPADSYGTTTVTGLAATSLTLTTLQASKDRIVLSGALTANINLVVPAWVKEWIVINNTTGSFSVTVKTPSGTGIAIPSGGKAYLFGDGVNITSNQSFGNLLNIVNFNASGTYTPSQGVRKIFVEVVGAGGGGGGVGATATGSIAVGGGGGAGGYASALIDASAAPATVTVGTGGAGGLGLTAANGGGQAGAAGGLSSFGSLVSASGGEGGPGSGTTTSTSGTIVQRVGGNGGVGTAGSVMSRGGAGLPGLATSTGNSIAGYGGVSFFSGSARGAFGVNNATGNGTDGMAGGGGSGAISDSAPTIGTVSGGKGGNGVVRIWEFS